MSNSTISRATGRVSRRILLRGAAILAGAASASLLAACSPTAPAPAAPAPAPTTAPAPAVAPTTPPTVAPTVTPASLRVFKVAGPAGLDGFMPFWPGLMNGYFADDGVDLDITYVGGPPSRAAFLNKEVDLLVSTLAIVGPALEANQPVKIVATTNDRSSFSLLARSELKDQVKTVEDLKGRNVGFPQAGGLAWLLGVHFLNTAGLDPDKGDVNYVQVGVDLTAAYASLKTGKVDAMVTYEPVTSRAILEGAAYPLIRSWVAEDRKKFVGVDKSMTSILSTRDDVLATRSQDVQGIVNGLKKGLAYIARTDSATLAQQFQSNDRTKEQLDGVDPKLAADMIDKQKTDITSGCVSKSMYDAEMQNMLKFGLMKTAAAYETFVDPKFAERAPSLVMERAHRSDLEATGHG